MALLYLKQGVNSHIKNPIALPYRQEYGATSPDFRILPTFFLCHCCALFNSLAPGRPGCQFKTAIFNLVLLIGIFTSSKDNALRWMPRDLTDDKSTLDQVLAWCRQATSHYLIKCWPSSMSPYSVLGPQWVNIIILDHIMKDSVYHLRNGSLIHYMGLISVIS